jgi:hypothetical protein
MQLARVTHIRCHQRDFNEPQTYVWVDERMTQEQFTALVKAAQDSYDQAGKDFEAAEQPPYASWGMPPYDKFPDKTVAEVKAVHDASQVAYKHWQEKKRTAQSDFGAHLKKLGEGQIELFSYRKPDLAFVLDWGHRHGQKTAYGETETNDLRGLVEADEDL